MKFFKPGTKVLFNAEVVTITSVNVNPNGYFYTVEWLNQGSPCSMCVYECQLEHTKVDPNASMTIGFKES